jgi:hypothetical protein
LNNGELLARAKASFDAFVTVDRNLAYQQNVASTSVAIIVLKAKSNRLADLRPLVDPLHAALRLARAGQVTLVELD